ncbi:MAG: hypothetical protein WDN25_16795 [Acetobacteraceae bacterium]
MLSASLWLLLAAGLYGSLLGALHLRAGGTRPASWRALPHGIIGLAGFVVLLLALRGPPRGQAMGVAAFGEIAAVLFAIALALGLVLPFLRRRGLGLAIAVHASVAIGGIVILAAYALVG